MAASTWTWKGGAGSSTVAANWNLTSGSGNANQYPAPGDTVLVPSGIIEDGLDEIAGLGSVTVQAGAQILVTAAGDGINLGTSAATSGTMTLNGGGIDVGAGTNGITIGNAGTGVLNVQNLGTVIDSATLSIGGSQTGPGSGHGTLALTGGGDAEILGAVALWSGSTLSVDSASGVDIGGSDLFNPGSLLVEAGHTLTGTGLLSAGVVNNGEILVSGSRVSSPGSLEITGAISGSGAITLATEAILQVDSTVADAVTFAAGGVATLIFKNEAPGTISTPIEGFNLGDRIEFTGLSSITNVTFTNVVGTTGTLTVTTNLGSYVLPNVTFAPGAYQGFFWYIDGATGYWNVAAAPQQVTWNVGNGALGTGSNWSTGSTITAIQQMNFTDGQGGTITGTATAANLLTTGTDIWSFQNTNVTLTGEPSAPYQPFALNDQGNLVVSGGILNAQGGGNVYPSAPGGANLTLSAGAQVSVEGLSVGYTQGEDGNVLVTGTGSGLNSVTTSPSGATFGGYFNVGVAPNGAGGQGEVTVASGGSVTATQVTVGSDGGSGELNVNTGGVVQSATGFTIGFASAVNGTVYGGTGDLNIGPGGSVAVTEPAQSVNPGMVIGSANGNVGLSTGLADGDVTVSGAGAVLNTNDNPLAIGLNSVGNLTVSQGGSVAVGTSTSTGTNALYVGRFGTGSLILTDPGSSLRSAGYSVIGRAGTGYLLVQNHATLTVDNDPTGVDGTLSIGAGQGNPNTVVASTQTGGTGNAQVTTGGYIYSQSDVTVAKFGVNGSLSIDSGGTVEAGFQVIIGQNQTVQAGGTLVTATGNTITPTALVLGGQGIIDVGAGGLLKADGSGIIAAGTSDILVGDGADTSATLNVTGAGATVNSEGYRIGIAAAGQGSLLISQGGTVLAATPYASDEAIYAGGSVAATGVVTVTDPGSELLANGQFSVGLSGQGSMLVENQGTVTTGDNAIDATEGFDIAQSAGANGTVTVTGARSLLSNIGRFVVGDAGLGSLSIAAGGTVTTTPGAAPGLAGLVIANTSSASGSSVDVSGAGSDLAITGSLVVGDAGSGALSLSQGASATAGSLDVGAGATGNGDVSLAGTGTTLDITGALTLGDQAAGELAILGGAQMTVGGGVVGSSNSAPGNLDVEGAGSRLTINTGTLTVGANGPAEFTLGIGATLQGEVANGPFGVVNEYGNVDPPTDPNDGTQNVGFGNSLIYDFYVANSGTIKITSGTATFYTPLATDETNAADGSTNGLWVIGAHDTLVMNATSVDNTQTFDFTSPSAASLVIGQLPQASTTSFDTFNGQTMPSLTGSIAPGSPNVLPGWNAPIENYQSGDIIVLQGLTYRSATASGDVVTVWSGLGGTGTPLGSLTFVSKSLAPSSAEAALAAAQLQCFAAGTRIETVEGPVAVERLRLGDRIVTADGSCEPVIWIGSRAVNCLAHPRPEAVWPVRVAAGAFGVNVPLQELYLSPDHAVFLNGVLIPVKLLANGTSITQVKQDRILYYHVELPEHAVILAQGLPVESYLDTGDRANFGGGGTIRLYPDFAARLAPDAAMQWEARGAAPLVLAGSELEFARQAVGVWRRPLQPAVNQTNAIAVNSR